MLHNATRRKLIESLLVLQVQGAICVQPPYVYVQTIAMLVNVRTSFLVSTLQRTQLDSTHHPFFHFSSSFCHPFRDKRATSEVNNIVTAVSFGMTLGVTLSVVGVLMLRFFSVLLGCLVDCRGQEWKEHQGGHLLRLAGCAGPVHHESCVIKLEK